MVGHALYVAKCHLDNNSTVNMEQKCPPPIRDRAATHMKLAEARVNSPCRLMQRMTEKPRFLLKRTRTDFTGDSYTSIDSYTI